VDKPAGGEFGGEGLDAANGIRHVVQDADAVDPVKGALELIGVINTEVAKLDVGGPRSPTPLLGGGYRSFAEINP
jgi:hypothetical protein